MENNKNQLGKKLPEVDTGNASNPTPHKHDMEPAGNKQLIDERGEKYLRESAPIEDEPDPQDQLDADEAFEKEK